MTVNPHQFAVSILNLALLLYLLLYLLTNGRRLASGALKSVLVFDNGRLLCSDVLLTLDLVRELLTLSRPQLVIFVGLNETLQLWFVDEG